MHQPFPTDRYVVRVRRLADLSQRDLAEVVGVPPSTIQRIETARGAVSVGMLVRVLDVAGLRLTVVDHKGLEVHPVAEDVIRDNAGRRFPAHLDVDPPDLVPPLRRLMPRYDRAPARGWYRQRPERDRLRTRQGVPEDHPTVTDIVTRDQELARERIARRRALAATLPTWDECECDTACWLGTTCEPECLCQCEPEQLLAPA